MRIVGLDTETYLITELNPIPPLICCTITGEGEDVAIYKHDDV